MIVLARPDNTPATAFYVRSRESSTLEAIRDGNYCPLFTTDERWADDAAGFAKDAYFQRFEDAFKFTGPGTAVGKRYCIWRVALQLVAGGHGAAEP